MPLLYILCFISLFQGVGILSNRLNHWEQKSFSSLHSFVTNKKSAQAAFFSHDLSLVFTEINKSTPDYLPLYKNDSTNKYKRYEQEVLQEKNFSKFVSKGHLKIVWSAETTSKIDLPIVLYHGSQLYQNGQRVRVYQLSDIGTPTLTQHPGMNEITLKYSAPSYTVFFFIFCLASWLGLLFLRLRKVLIFRLKLQNKTIFKEVGN